MAQVSLLKSITIHATQNHTATVIFVHGLGDSGRGFIPVTDNLRTDPGLRHVKWLLPHSPSRPVTANADIVMPSWSDMYHFGHEGAEDETGILQTSRQLNDLITAEVNAGIDASRIVIGGFSQGGAMSLLTGLTSPKKLAGIAVLSGWLPLCRKIKNMMSPHATSIPLFWGHGTSDIVVNFDLCKKHVEYLTKNCGISLAKDNEIKGIRCKVYGDLAHITNQQELDDLKGWLKAVIPKDK